MPIAASALPAATMIGCSAISALCSLQQQPDGEQQRLRHQRQHLGEQLRPRPGGSRQFALDVIVDGADAQGPQRQPARTGPARRHRFGDDGFRGPVKLHSGLAATDEEIGVAAAEKIEAEIERGIGQSRKYRPRDQAIAAAVDDRHGPADFVGRVERRMAAKPALAFVIELRKYRSADHIRAVRLRGAQHQLQPVRRGDFVVVDHQEIGGRGERRQRGLEGGVDGVAIALPRLDHAETLELAGCKKFGGDRYAGACRWHRFRR